MRVVIPHLLVFLLMLLPAEESDAQSFGLDALADSALSTDCLDWKIDGICIWIRCSIFGCYVVTSPLISHRLPDLVVQSYINPGEPPWNEWKPIAKALAATSSSIAGSVFGFELGGGTAGTGTSVHKFSDSLQYFETDAVGNPIAALASRAAGPFLCQSDVTPMLPYFSCSGGRGLMALRHCGDEPIGVAGTRPARGRKQRVQHLGSDLSSHRFPDSVRSGPCGSSDRDTGD